MIKSILLCTDGSASAHTAAQYTFHLAHKLSARVKALHVIDVRMMEGPYLADLAGWIGAQPYGDQVNHIRPLLEERGRSILAGVEQAAAKTHCKIETELRTGHPAAEILESETLCELVVMGQQGEHAELSPAGMGSIVDRITRASTRPCLITPTPMEPLTGLAAAFDGSDVAGKALHEALELSAALELPITLLTATEGLGGRDPHQVLHDAEGLADAHGVRYASRVVEGAPQDAIPPAMKEANANLLIMGSHGHSRFRELILGSATAQLLERMTFPILFVR